MRLQAALVVVVIASWASPAGALKQRDHYRLVKEYCTGLMPELCEEIAVQAYLVDAWDFSALDAHAQTAEGQTLCLAADAVVRRLYEKGSGAAVALRNKNVTGFALLVGGALHTLADACAHRGMRNPEHSWLSRIEQCQGSPVSPDSLPESMSCASGVTQRVMQEVLTAVMAASWSADDMLRGDNCNTHWPNRTEICDEYLALASAWDGTHLQWDGSKVTDRLVEVFVESLKGGRPHQASFCDGEDITAPDLAVPESVLGTEPPTCLSVKLLCPGLPKCVDSQAISSADETGNDLLLEGEPTGPGAGAGGCSVSGGPPTGLLAALLLGALGLIALRPRRREHGSC